MIHNPFAIMMLRRPSGSAVLRLFLTLDRTLGWGMPPQAAFLLRFTVSKIEVWFFCTAYFSTFLPKFCKWQVSMSFSFWACLFVLKVSVSPRQVSLSSSCHDTVNANVPCLRIFPLVLFNIHDESSYPWWFKCNSALNQAQLQADDLRTGPMTSSLATETSALITLDRI